MNANRALIRDSFDRFGDDLSEELLSGLSLEECFDCECVSKQFKRCLFPKQTRLAINWNRDDFMTKLKANLNDKRNDILKIVLNKCVAINDIVLNSINNISDEMIATITENCEHLKSIAIEGSIQSVSGKTWQLFGEKFGHSLQRISLHRPNDDCIESLFRLTPHLIECHGIELNWSGFLYSDLHLPKLKTISAYFNDKTDFKLFADQFADRVEKMDLYRIHFGRDCVDSEVIDMFAQLSRFERLKAFKIGQISCADELMNQGLNRLAKRCLSLRELNLSSFTNNGEVTDQKYRFSRPFDSLKRLFLFVKNSWLTKDFEWLSSCPQLVELRLKCNHSVVDNLDAIQSFAPNLRSISLLVSNAVINSNTFISLSKLHLFSVKIHAKELNITDIDLRDFIRKCVLLRRINLSTFENLSASTIEAFTSLAKSNPNYNYSLNATLSANDESRHSSIANDLPKNFELNIRYVKPLSSQRSAPSSNNTLKPISLFFDSHHSCKRRLINFNQIGKFSGQNRRRRRL